MKQYKDLNLKKIRDEFDLDFAHFTYKSGQCSCCYGPLDQPSLYWKNREIPVEVKNDNETLYSYHGTLLKPHQIQFILFKNATNGSGTVKKTDTIEGNTDIEWGLYNDKDTPNFEKLESICKALMQQLDEDYIICIPSNSLYCIAIITVDRYDSFDMANYSKCITLKNNTVIELEVK